jgi:HEXXH motif-containing protein
LPACRGQEDCDLGPTHRSGRPASGASSGRSDCLVPGATLETRSLDLTRFDPCPARGETAAGGTQQRLAESLRYIFARADGHLSIPRAEAERLLAQLVHSPASPLLFAAYSDLVFALKGGELETAQRLVLEMAATPVAPVGPRVVDLGDPRHDTKAARYLRYADTDADVPLTLSAPAPGEAAEIRSLIAQAFALLDAGNPSLAGEIRALVREIVLASRPPDPAAATHFDGVSSFMLFGAVILNVGSYTTAVEMVQALAHESGHNLMFALCVNGPLQENDDEERYESPLRADRRPMDGIVHATYVTARMHQSLQRLIDAGALDSTQIAEARAANLANAKWFGDGTNTIERHGRLTPLGRAVMDGAARYMAAFI